MRRCTSRRSPWPSSVRSGRPAGAVVACGVSAARRSIASSLYSCPISSHPPRRQQLDGGGAARTAWAPRACASRAPWSVALFDLARRAASSRTSGIFDREPTRPLLTADGGLRGASRRRRRRRRGRSPSTSPPRRWTSSSSAPRASSRPCAADARARAANCAADADARERDQGAHLAASAVENTEKIKRGGSCRTSRQRGRAARRRTTSPRRTAENIASTRAAAQRCVIKTSTRRFAAGARFCVATERDEAGRPGRRQGLAAPRCSCRRLGRQGDGGRREADRGVPTSAAPDAAPTTDAPAGRRGAWTSTSSAEAAA